MSECQPVIDIVDNAPAVYIDIIDGQSGGGGSTQIPTIEPAHGLINGSNAIFTSTYTFIPETLQVHENGILQRLGLDYTITSNQSILYSLSPAIGELLTFIYLKTQ